VHCCLNSKSPKFASCREGRGEGGGEGGAGRKWYVQYASKRRQEDEEDEEELQCFSTISLQLLNTPLVMGQFRMKLSLSLSFSLSLSLSLPPS
jgi:hypothetical protein